MKRRELALLTDAISAYRLTRLITKDTLLTHWRDHQVYAAYERKLEASDMLQVVTDVSDMGGPSEHFQPGDWAKYAEGDHMAPKLATLLTCRWCAGVWVAGAVVVARAAFPRQWDLAARMLTVASAAALIAGLER